MLAVKQARPDIVKTLLRHGADPSVKTAAGTTALQLAQIDDCPACLDIAQLLRFAQKR